MNFSKNNLFDYLYLKDQKKVIAVVVITLIGSAYLGFITPKAIKELYDSYKVDGDTTGAIRFLAFIFIFEYILHLVYQLGVNKYIEKLVVFIRARSFKNWLLTLENAGGGRFGRGKYPMGEVLSRVLTDTEAVIEMVSTGSFKIIIDFTFILSCFVGFITLNTTSGLALMGAEILMCFLLILGSKKMGVVYMAVRKSTGIMSRVIANLSGGFRYTYFHPNENYASKRGYDSFEDFLKKQLKANIWDASYFSIAESLFPILLALLVVVFPYSNITEMAVLAAIIDLLQRSIAPIKEVAGKISSIQRAKTGIIRIEEFNSDLDSMAKAQFDQHYSKIELKKLKFNLTHFEYPKKLGEESFSLNDIEFEAFPGELVGIVGQSGCGKSTLLKMLSADIVDSEISIDLDCLSGKKILLNEQNIDKLPDYRRQVSIVSQDSHVFSDTLKLNISMGESGAESFEDFWQRVRSSIAYIDKWGVEPETLINTKELSLGQKQLISALRSCYLVKPIVLFDEISSGLDSELELALRKLVLMIQEKSLTFIVAHRIETIIEADKILVMKDGRLVDRGNHQSLMRDSAPYQDVIAQLNSL